MSDLYCIRSAWIYEKHKIKLKKSGSEDFPARFFNTVFKAFYKKYYKNLTSVTEKSLPVLLLSNDLQMFLSNR